MGLLRRSPPIAEAVHARVGDGEHLWLAVRGADTLALRGPGRDDLAVPVETEGDLLVARFALAAALAADDSPELDLTLVAPHGRRGVPVALADERPAGPTVEAPPTLDRRWVLSVVEVDGAAVVTRRPNPPAVEVAGFATSDDGVRVRLATSATEARLRLDGATLAVLPLVDGTLLLPAGALPVSGGARAPDLPEGAVAAFVVDGRPVVRRRNLLARPHQAVTLPPLAGGLELRYRRDGHLVLARPRPR